MTSLTTDPAPTPAARRPVPRVPRRVRVVPALLVLLACSSLAAAVVFDLATSAAERAAVGGGTATTTVVPGVLLLLAAAVVLQALPGDTVGRVLAVVALVWTLDGVLSGWMAYGNAHDLPGTSANTTRSGASTSASGSAAEDTSTAIASGLHRPGTGRPVG